MTAAVGAAIGIIGGPVGMGLGAAAGAGLGSFVGGRWGACFFFTLVTGPRRSLSLKLSDTSWGALTPFWFGRMPQKLSGKLARLMVCGVQGLGFEGKTD